MSYENAVPKPLKFLISDGKMIDDAGNVIAESETLKDLYTKWNPEVKKYLLSDGSVVDENNNLIVKNDYYKKIYDQADPKVAKYLHSDGTIDENPGGGGGADLENNHQTTIDVSEYTQPVEITPSEGKDGMKKATITLSNIPSGSVTLHCWGHKYQDETVGIPVFYTLSATPSANDMLIVSAGESGLPAILTTNQYKVKAFADGKITVLYNGPEGWEDYTYDEDPYFYRDQSGDISLS